MGRTSLAIVLLASGLVTTAPATARAGDDRRTINVSVERRSGERVRGPVELVVTAVNVLRYEVLLGVTVSFPSAPDMTVPFVPPVVGPAGPGVVARAQPMPADVAPMRGTIAAVMQRLAELEANRLEKVHAPVEGVTRSLNGAKAVLEALVAASDTVLKLDGGAAHLSAQSREVAGKLDEAIGLPWPSPDTESQLIELARIKSDFAGLDPRTDQNRHQYEFVEKRLGELQAWYDSVGAAGSVTATADAARARLRQWMPILTAIGDSDGAAFALKPFPVGCGFSFITGRESKVELLKRDRLAGPSAPEIREELMTVVCSSPVSISAGFGVSSLDGDTFVLIPSTKTVDADGVPTTTNVSRFDLESSTHRVVPLVALNVRVWEPTDWLSVHLTAGAAVDSAKGTVGTHIERFIGPSVSFWRTFFVTFGGGKIGRYWGFTSRLGGGFEVGDEVPAGVSEPPVLRDGAHGAFVAFSYRIR